jgi:uroporphyrinogen-III decarboxylase
VLVGLHTDGNILEIIPDLVECGVDILNPQFRANTLEGLVRVARGKVCLNQDLDRQLMPFVEPAKLKEHVRETARELSLPQGGLMLIAEIGPDVPLANIEAIIEVFEEIGGPQF